MVGKIYSQEIRNLFFRMYLCLKITLYNISLYLEINIRTLYRWITQGKIKPINPTRILNNTKYSYLEQFIHNKIEEDNTITLIKLTSCIYNNFNIKISISTLYRILISFNLTYKKGSKYYTEANIEKQKEFINNINPLINKERIIALDESCFFLNETRLYARSKKGTNAIIKKPGIRGKASSLLLSIESTGIVSWKLYKGSINAIIFREFLDNNIPNNSMLVLDNARIHHASDILKINKLTSIKELANIKNIKINYLPPYSPYLNPVEFCFNIIKSFVFKHKPRNFNELKNCISNSMSILTKEVCNSLINKTWFKK